MEHPVKCDRRVQTAGTGGQRERRRRSRAHSSRDGEWYPLRHRHRSIEQLLGRDHAATIASVIAHDQTSAVRNRWYRNRRNTRATGLSSSRIWEPLFLDIVDGRPTSPTNVILRPSLLACGLRLRKHPSRMISATKTENSEISSISCGLDRAYDAVTWVIGHQRQNWLKHVQYRPRDRVAAARPALQRRHACRARATASFWSAISPGGIRRPSRRWSRCMGPWSWAFAGGFSATRATSKMRFRRRFWSWCARRRDPGRESSVELAVRSGPSGRHAGPGELASPAGPRAGHRRRGICGRA